MRSRLKQLVMVVCIFPVAFSSGGAHATNTDRERLVEGRFGHAMKLGADGRSLELSLGSIMENRPLTFECGVKVDSFQIL